MAFITIEFLSEVLGRQTSIDVIIPQKRTSGEIGIANNAKAEKYKPPVLLHGLSDNSRIWARRTSIDRYATEKGIAVIDGTNPHTYDASYPGVRETVIDPGIAWDTKKLYEKKGEIFELTSHKKSSYRKAYLYLRAAGLISDEMKEVAKSCVLTEKLLKNAEVQIRGALYGKGTQFSESIRLQRGITGQGSVYFESLARAAEKRILVKDVHGISEIYFSYLYKEAKRNGLNVTVSYSPEDRSVIDGILFEDASVCFSLYCNENECDKIINCERFEDKSAFSDVKQKYAFAARCKNALEAQAYSALSDAAKYHEEIEKVYAPCTDYSITERLTDELCEMIFT